MTPKVLAPVLFVGMVSLAVAQGPIVPPPKSPPVKSELRDQEMALTIEGCIRGRVLKPARDTIANALNLSLVRASQFSLEGPKELLGQLKQSHDNHQDEITGIALIPAAQAVDGEVKSKQVGKRTRITGSAGSGGDGGDGTPVRPDVRSIRLKVTSLKHLSDKCSIPGA